VNLWVGHQDGTENESKKSKTDERTCEIRRKSEIGD